MSKTLLVWLIDDDEDEDYFFESALKEMEYPVDFSTFRDCEEAISLLSDSKANLPDFVFLDWNMPRVPGMDCLERIRSYVHLNNLPVIVYTTSVSIIDKNAAKALGASYFLTKPMSITELSKKLQQLFNQDWTEQAFVLK